MEEADVERLRAAGLDDRGIVDANQVVAYYNYVNRVADGLGVELEPDWPSPLRAERPYWATVPATSLPWLSVEQMRALDRIAVQAFGLTLERMMENAGRHLAELVRRSVGGRAAERRVVVLAGPGGNGGGGLVAARHLAAAGARVTVVLARPAEALAPATQAQHRIVTAMGLPVVAEPPDGGEFVVDALLGYSQAGPPRGPVARLIEWTRGRRVLSLDTPSGLELERAVRHEPHVEAETTLTLAAPKEALRTAAAMPAVGTLYLADLTIPEAAYLRLGLEWRTPYSASPVVRIGGLEPPAA